MARPRVRRPWRASLLGLSWLFSLALPGAHAGAFRVAETRPRDPRAAALWQHPQVAQALRVWAAVATGIFHLPTDVTITPAPCGRIDGFYDPGQQQLHLCEELLTYYAGVLTPPGGDPRSPAPVVWDATLVSFLHLVGHAVVALLDLPVTAELEEAADAVGVAFLVAGSPEDERTVLAGSAALVQRSRSPEPPHLVPWWAYYEALNARQYAQTWGQLAPQFKQTHFCCESDGSFQFGRYRAWWEQVARVEVLDAHVQERQPAEVVVQATVRYVMRNGTVTEEQHRFRLVAEPATQRWLIATQTRGVQRPRAQ